MSLLCYVTYVQSSILKYIHTSQHLLSTFRSLLDHGRLVEQRVWRRVPDLDAVERHGHLWEQLQHVGEGEERDERVVFLEVDVKREQQGSGKEAVDEKILKIYA